MEIEVHDNSKKTPFDLYLNHLDNIFQKEPDFFSFASKDEIKSRVLSISYKDIPEKGFITGLTYGLSEVTHPEWIAGRPELIISVESENVKWAHSIAFMVSHFRTSKLFSIGNVFDFDTPISDDSKMQGFFIFAPSLAGEDDYTKINVGEYNINLVGAYPIYKNEIDFVLKNGFQGLWDADDYDIYNIKRKDLGLFL